MVKPHYRPDENGIYTKVVNHTAGTMGDLSPDFNASNGYVGSERAHFNGEKFAGGFGATQLFTADYWTLRERSSQLFTENLYARGLIRRLITNEINTGLTPEAAPDEEIIGVAEDSLNDWTETVENRFAIWGKNPRVCDWKHQKTFGAMQRAARLEALASGDVLVVIRMSQRTNLPVVQLISGSKVRTPMAQTLRKGHTIKHGVELDSHGRVAAHWVNDGVLGESKRIPAFGEKSGRKVSWLVYGTDKRLDAIRGEPILALVLQSLKEVDRYRDAVQRKAVVNSIVAMFIKKGENKMGTLPVTGGAVRKDQITVEDGTDAGRTLSLASQLPGVVMEELQVGEEPVLLGGQGTDINFGPFEEAMLQTVAWANEIPPEILRLAFSNNYSASQAAINEFKIYLNKIWSEFGEEFCMPIYTEWLISEVLLGKMAAPGLVESRRDPNQHDVLGAWLCTDWYGSIKPSTDMVKQVKGAGLLIDRGLSTHARESRGTTGTKFSKNVRRLKRENELLVEAQRPLAEFRAEFAAEKEEELSTPQATAAEELEAMLDEYLGGLNA